MDILHMLHILAGPLVGAVIGYFTNYIAVKMLFRPHYPVKIGGWTLPFTPGIIPRRKPQLARAVGRAVGDTLLTGSDIREMFLSEEMERTVGDAVCNFICNDGENGPRTIRNLVRPRVGSEAYAVGREQLEESVCGRILSEVEGIAFGEIIAEEGLKVFREKTAESLLAMMISDETIRSLGMSIGEYVTQYIRDNGHDMLLPMLDKQVTELENKPFSRFLEDADMDEARLRALIGKSYREVVDKQSAKLLEKFHVAQVVEDKINEMDVQEVETLALSVMEKELNAIVSLGALIGFVIGILNIFL